MPTVYRPAFSVGQIDASGFHVAVPSITLNVFNVTAAASLGTVSVNAQAYVAEGSFTANVGDVVEYSHGSYPLKFRQTLAATQDEAYLHPENSTITFILQNLYASTADSKTADVYAQDLDDTAQRPFLLGSVVAGETTKLPFQSAIPKNLRLMLVSKDDSGAQDTADLAYAQYEDIEVPGVRSNEFPIVDFGALADGSTDDSAALQAALDAAYLAGGGTIVFPRGITKLSSASTKDFHAGASKRYTHIRFVGAGLDSRVLLTGLGSTTAINIDNANLVEYIGLCFEGSTLGGTSTATVDFSNRAIRSGYVTKTVYDRCTFAGLATDASGDNTGVIIVNNGALVLLDCAFGGTTASFTGVVGLYACTGLHVERTSFIDYHYGNGNFYNKLTTVGACKTWIKEALPLTGDRNALQIAAFTIKNCSFDEGCTAAAVDVGNQRDLVWENNSSNSGLYIPPSFPNGKVLKATGFRQVTVRNSWVGLVTNVTDCETMEFANCGIVDIDGLIHQHSSKWISLTGTTAVCNIKNSSLVGNGTYPNGINNSAGAVINPFTLKDSDASHDLTLKWNENSAANRTFNFLINGANRSVSLSGDLTVSGAATVLGTNTGDTITVGVTPIASGGNGRLLLQAAGTVQQYSDLVYDGTNLGVGTASPAAKLHVSASANSSLGVRLINSGTGGSAAASIIVGESVAGDQIFTIYYANTSNAIYGSNAAVLKAGTAVAGGLLFVHEGNYPADFYTNNTIRMRLQAGGNLTVGTTYDGVGARLVALSTGTQFAAAYDGSNYMTLAVASNGAVTLDAVGSLPSFIFSDDVSLSAGKRLSLTHDATNAALRLIPMAGDPSSPSNGDIWYNSTTNKFRKRQNGTTSDLDTGGGGGGVVNNATLDTIPVSDGVDLFNSQITDNGSAMLIGQTAAAYIGFWGATASQQAVGWSGLPVTPTTAFDPATDTYAEFMDYVCTLVEQLKTYGILGP